MDQSTPPKSDTLSSQVLEYFRKHSGNQNLSSYLRGIIPQQESKVKCEIDVNIPAIDEIFISESDDKGKIERDINVSPTSSLTSNRKLEWDNGADIGYENSNKVNLHKSFSLPTLTTLEKIELGKTPLKLPLESNEMNPIQAYCPSNGSAKACIISTTSSSCTPEEQKLDTTTSSSFAFKPLFSETPSEVGNGKESITKLVHRKVGSPVAQSTPITERPMYYRGTFPEEKDKVSTIAMDNPENNKMHITELKCVAKFTKSKIVRLAATKPILIDCVDYRKYNDKDIQTVKCVEFASVGVQTEQTKVDTTERTENIPYDKEKQFIEYIKYSDSSEQSGSRSIGTNTVSDLVSNCNSFEYLCPTDTEDKASSEKFNMKSSGVKEINLENSVGLKRFEKTTDNQSGSNKSSLNSNDSEKTLSSNVTEVSTKSTPLGEMISCNLSKHLKVDIDKSIFLLQRLLKSKRYDKVTKDYFVKKIVEKILKSNYSSDSSSPSKVEERKDNEVFYQEGGSSTSSKVSEKLLEPSLKKRLQENVPWIPVTFNKDVKTPKNLEVKMFSNDIFPEDREKRKVKDSRFTITSSILDHQQLKETNIPDYFRMSAQTQSSQDENKPQKPTIKNWKDDITRSEKLFETGCLKFDGDKTDSLVRFAKKERNNQLNWINDEILHLNKLRNLLQENNCSEMGNNKASEKPNIEIKVLTKPHVEDMKKMKKSASVYVITTDRTTSEDNNGHNATSSLGTCPTTKDLSCKGKVFNITSELREAKLVSSEVYQSNKPYTCVRRYVFEIPVQCSCDTLPCAHEHNDKRPPVLPLSDQDYGTSSVAFEDAGDISSSEQQTASKETHPEPDNIAEKSSLNKGSTAELPRIDSSKREPDRYSRGSQASGTEFEEKKRRVHSVTAVPYLPLAPLNAKHPPSNGVNQDNQDRFSRGTQSSYTELLDHKRKVQSLDEVPHPASTTKNVIASQSAPVSSRSKSHELANVVLNEAKADNEVSIGTNTEERYRRPSVEFRGMKDLSVESQEPSAGTQSESQGPTNARELYRSAIDRQRPSIDSRKASSDYREPTADYEQSAPGYQRTALHHNKPAPNYQRSSIDCQTSDPDYQRPAPDYQRPGSDYQTSNSDYQRVNPMYQRPAPDFQTTNPNDQKPAPNYQRSGADYQRSGVDYQRSEANYQRPTPDDQTSNSDYRRLTPVFQRPLSEYQQESVSDHQRYGPDFHPTAAPEYQKHGVEVQTLNPNYQRPATDYHKSASDYQKPAPNYQRPGAAYPIPDPDYHKVPPAYQKPASDFHNPAAEYQDPGTNFETSDPNYQRPLVSYQRVIPDYPKPGYGYQKPAADYQKPAADYQKSSIDRQIPNIQYQQPNSAYEKPTHSYRKPTSDSQRPATDYQTSDYRTPDSDHQRSNGAPNHQKPAGDFQKSGADYQTSDHNYQNYTRAYQRRASDHQKPPADYQKTASNYQKPASNYYRPDTDYQTSDPAYERPTSPIQRPAPDYQKPNGDYQKSVPNYQSSNSNNQVPDSHYQRVPSTNHRIVPDYQQPPADYQKSPDYEKSDGDYQTADPNYQKLTPTYQRLAPDYEIPAPDYQKPAPDYQRPGTEYETPDSERQGPAAERPASPYQTPAQDYPKPGPSAQSDHKRNITPTSSASSVSTSSSSQTILIRICPCCKRNNSKYKSVLQGLPNEIENSLCRPCHRNTTMAVDPTTGQYKTYPEHVCNCYTLMKTETVNKIKQTVKQLEELENEEQCCNCSHKRCKCPSFGRSKKGIAYTLTLEDDDNASESSEQDVHRKRSLDEIKLKIPDKKKHRSKSQHKGHHRKHHRKHKKDQSSSKMTLQEYLCANRPNFVQNAEERRKTLIDLAYMRERRCQKYKQLLAMTNGMLPNNDRDQTVKKKGLYTTKEMRKITAKNYNKLPEVQKKLEKRRENDNKKANKLLADIFNKKLQQNTLKGKVDISTTTSVIKFI